MTRQKLWALSYAVMGLVWLGTAIHYAATGRPIGALTFGFIAGSKLTLAAVWAFAR